MSNMSFRTDNLTYYNRLHKQLERKRTKPTSCIKCGRSDIQIEWSNISGQYRNLDDFEALCKSCHQTYDVYKLGKLVRGRKPVQIAKILETKQLYSWNKPKTTAVNQVSNTAVTAAGVDNNKIDLLINEFSDLTKAGKDMSGWHANNIRKLGVENWVRLAKTARADGKNPPALFNWLIKNA